MLRRTFILVALTFVFSLLLCSSALADTNKTFSWGNPGGGDIPLVIERWDSYDTDIGLYRGTGWWFINKNRGWVRPFDHITDDAFFWGNPGDTPLVGNFGSSSGQEVGIRRPATAEWFIDTDNNF